MQLSIHFRHAVKFDHLASQLINFGFQLQCSQLCNDPCSFLMQRKLVTLPSCELLKMATLQTLKLSLKYAKLMIDYSAVSIK